MAREVRAGRAFVEVGLKSTVERGVRKIQSELSGLTSSLSTAGATLLAGGAAMGGMIAMPLKYAAAMEQTTTAYNTLIGNTQRAAATLEKLRDLATETPLGFVELADAGRKLLAFGSAPQTMAGELRMLGDIATATGMTIGELAEIYGKNRVQGRLQGEDINQLTGRGIPVIQEIALQFGVDQTEVRKLVSDGLVEFRHLEQAFVSMTSAGGTFFGGMAAQSNTFTARIARIGDTLISAILPLGNELMAVIAPAIDTVAQMITVLGATAASTDGLAASWVTAAASAAAVGAGMMVVSRTVAAVNAVVGIARTGITALGVAYSVVRAAIVAATAAWIATQAAMWAVAIATAAAYKAVAIYGARAIAARAASLAWAAAAAVARTAMLALTNVFVLGKVAIGGYMLAADAAQVATSLLAGRLVAASIGARVLAVGAGLVSAALTGQSIAALAVSTAQTIAAAASSLLSGGLAGSAVAAGISTAAASILSGAWVTAGGIISSVYAILAAPFVKFLVPAIAVAAAISVVAAAVAAAWVSSGLLGEAWEYVKSSFMSVISVVKEVASALKSALAAGQYANAAKILWAGIKLLFFMGVQETIRLFKSMPARIWEIFKRFNVEFVSVLWNIFSSIPTILGKILSGESLGSILESYMGGGDFLGGQIHAAKTEIASLKKEADAAAEQAKRTKEEQEAARAELDARAAAVGLKAGSGAAEIARAEAAKKQADAEKAAADAARDRIAELQNEIREMEIGADANDLYSLKLKGVNDEQLAAIKALQDQRRALKEAREEEERRTKSMLDGLKKQGDRDFENGASPLAIFSQQLAEIQRMAGAGQLTRDQAREATDEARGDRDSRVEQLRSEGKQLEESLQTPLEKFGAETTRISRLLRDGAIDRSTATRAMAKARETYEEDIKTAGTGADDPRNTVAMRGTQAALDSLRRNAAGGSQLAPENQWAVPLVENARQQLAASMQMPERLAGLMARQQRELINTRELERLANNQLNAAHAMHGTIQRIETNTKPQPFERI